MKLKSMSNICFGRQTAKTLQQLDKKILKKMLWTRFCLRKIQLEFSYYWAAAEDIRTKFFDTYKGLKEWHNKQHAFGKESGYIQSSWGPIRRTPYPCV